MARNDEPLIVARAATFRLAVQLTIADCIIRPREFARILWFAQRSRLGPRAASTAVAGHPPSEQARCTRAALCPSSGGMLPPPCTWAQGALHVCNEPRAQAAKLGVALAQDAALEQRDLGLPCVQPAALSCEAALDTAAPLQREVGLIDIRAPAPRVARLTVGNRALHQHGARAKAHGEPTCTGAERPSAHRHSLRDLWAEGGREGHCTTPRARAGRCSTRGCPPPPPSRMPEFRATESRTLAPSMTSALPAPSTSTPPACVALPLTTCTRRSKSLPPSMTSMALDICGTSHERECGPRQRAEEQRQRCAPPRRRGSPPRRPRRGSRRRRSQRAASRRAGTRRTGGARASPRPRSR